MRSDANAPSGHFQQPQDVLRAVLESPHEWVVFALDRAYRYLAFNENHARRMQRMCGTTPRLGDDMLAYIESAEERTRTRKNFDRALAGESFMLQEEHGEESAERSYSEDVYHPIFDEDAQIVGLTVCLTDVTSRRKAELELSVYRTRLEEIVRQRTAELELSHAQLLHVQKLESLGVLAGGIAHDFNNLLAVILGRTELAAGLLPPENPVRPHLAIVQETALEARLLTKQLLGYSGKGKFMVQRVDLNELVESLTPLLSASVTRAVTLKFELAREPEVVEADATQLRQALLNLVTNAAEALVGQPGEVVVRTSMLDLDAEQMRRLHVQPLVAPGRYVCLAVADTGTGIEERVQSKLFEPFFTTKFSGRGLGLAAVLGIATGHRGAVAVVSELGHGSVFSLYLPAVEGEPAPLAVANETSTSLGAGTVLVVDDEKAVRSVLSMHFKGLGYQVLEASGGREACELYREHAAEIDLVLLDLTMPEMNGEQTLRALQTVNPRVRALVMTGYAEDEVRDRFAADDLAGVLPKPFSRQELIGAVTSALAR